MQTLHIAYIPSNDVALSTNLFFYPKWSYVIPSFPCDRASHKKQWRSRTADVDEGHVGS